MKQQLRIFIALLLFVASAFSQTGKEGTPTITRSGASRSLDVTIRDSNGNAATPSVGQKTMANSSPVVISSDQSAIPFKLQDSSGASVTLGQKLNTFSIPVVVASDQIISVTGLRSNAGTDTTSGKTHSTIGGTDGTNLRPLLTDDLGRAVIKRGSRFQFRNTVTLTGTTETTLIASVASIRHCIQFLIICNNSTTERVTLSLRDSTGGTVIPLGGFEPNASGKSPAIPFHFPVALEQTTANNNWTIQATGTSPNVTIVAVSERVN